MVYPATYNVVSDVDWSITVRVELVTNKYFQKNNVSFYNDIEDCVILQCEYCNSYRQYNTNELTPKMNTKVLNYKNIGKYYINIKSSKIELHIVECID